MNETMFTYISKEHDTNLAILNNYPQTLKEFKAYLSDHHNQRWVILATGSSANAIECAKYYVEHIAQIHVDIRIPFLFANYPTPLQEDELYIAVSQSGHSASTIKAAKRLNEQVCFVMSADVNSPIVKECSNFIDLGCGEEKVDLVTMGFSATLINFMLMGLQAAYEWKRIDDEEYQKELRNIKDAILKINPSIDRCVMWYEKNKESFLHMKELAIIGYGAGYGVSREAETKITETIHCMCHGYELEEYMHGPYLALHSKLTVFFLESDNESLNIRLQSLKHYIDKISNHGFLISDKDYGDDRVLVLPNVANEYLMAILYVIPIQYLSYRVCADLGEDPMITPYDDFDHVLESKI